MDTKQILITGGTGFIGNYLCSELLKEGHFLTIVTRSPEKYAGEEAENQKFVSWDHDLVTEMEQTDVVINLVGESLAGKRWTEEARKKIYESRINTTRKLVDAMTKAAIKPALLISASGINIYNDSGDAFLDESSSEGDGFLAEVCRDWEAEAKRVAEIGVRVVIPRISMVLGESGGALDMMKLPFRFFIGGPIGSGHQYVSWIHIADLCSAILFSIENTGISGPFNACSPKPETMNAFAAILGDVMNRPSFFRVPEFLLNIVLGEAAQVILGSLRVQPKVLQISDFEFQFEDLEEALSDVI